MSFGIPVRNGLGVGLLASSSLATRNAFSPAALFAAGEPGAWYDPSDLTTMFQGNMGTTPVTAAGQTVGLILDKSKQQTFATRINLLNYSQQFNDATWAKTRASISADATTAPDGTLTADKLVEDTTATSTHFTSQTITVSSGITFTYSVYAKAAERTRVSVQENTSGATVAVNLSNGTVISGSGVVQDAGNGWYRISVTGTVPSTSAIVGIYLRDATSSSYTGDGTSGAFLWGAQLETGTSSTTYQPTGLWPASWQGNHAYQTASGSRPTYQIDTSGRPFLLFDGTDDWLLTPTITPGTNAAQAFAGVRKLSDATTNVLLESSSVSTTNPGTIGIFAPSGAAANYNWRSQGSNTGISVSGVTFAAPITNVVTGIGDIAADTCILRVNGAQVGSTAADQGTGNYLAYPIYIGRRNGTSFPLNGRIYSLIIRFGANLTSGQISQTESWVNGKTGAY